jgi:hypothetical protein
MRYLFGFVCVCAFGVMPMVGCSDYEGTGGSGGSGGTGGMGGTGGTGGMPECQGDEDCDDSEECTVDTCDEGVCSHAPAGGVTCDDNAGVCIEGSCTLWLCGNAEDGTACFRTLEEAGVCLSGACVERQCEVDSDCNAYKDCTLDSCLESGICQRVAVQDGTPCAGGMCESGECILEGTVLPCTEQGIRNAIAAGGGPYTFDCDGSTTVVTEAEIVIDNDVILDGGGNLTVDGNEDHRAFFVPENVTAELRGFTLTRGRASGGLSEGRIGGSLYNIGTLTLTESAVTNSRASDDGGGIYNAGVLAVTNSEVAQNVVICPQSSST